MHHVSKEMLMPLERQKIITKSVHEHNSQKWCTPKNIQIYKTIPTHTHMQCSLYKSQTTWKCVHLNQPHIPPSTHRSSTIKVRAKHLMNVLHIKMINSSFVAVNHGDGKKDKKVKLLRHRDRDASREGGGTESHFVWWSQHRNHK